MDVLKVSAKSNPTHNRCTSRRSPGKGNAEMQAIGAGALNQAVKAVAIARDLLLSGMDLICIPAFGYLIDGENGYKT